MTVVYRPKESPQLPDWRHALIRLLGATTVVMEDIHELLEIVKEQERT